MSSTNQECSPEGTTTTTLKEIAQEKIEAQTLKDLQTKYGVENPIEVSCDELATLRSELSNTSTEVDAQARIEKFLEKQKKSNDTKSLNNTISDKLKTQGLSAVSLETVTNGIKSSRLNEMKTEFEKTINPILDKYEFLDTNSKNVIKLALANKLINSQAGGEVLGVLGDFKSGFENLDLDSLADLASDSGENEKGKDSVKSGFEKILTSYVEGFNKIDSKLNEFTPKLTPEQKQNIIGNMDYFRNPGKIEAGFNEKILNEITIENKDKKASNDLSPDEEIKLKNYLTGSRNKIEEVAKQFEGGEKVLDLALNLASGDGKVSEAVRDIVKFLLEIPILGDILAFFMGLNKENPLEDFNNQTALYKVLKNFKSLGVQKDENGKQTKSGKGVFKDIDLSGINYADVKGELKQIKEIAGDKKEDEFWTQAFGKGIKKDGIIIKFEIIEEQSKDKKISSEEFKEIIKTGFEKYNEAKKQQKQAEVDKIRAEMRGEKKPETIVENPTEELTKNSPKTTIIGRVKEGWNSLVGESVVTVKKPNRFNEPEQPVISEVDPKIALMKKVEAEINSVTEKISLLKNPLNSISFNEKEQILKIGNTSYKIIIADNKNKSYSLGDIIIDGENVNFEINLLSSVKKPKQEVVDDLLLLIKTGKSEKINSDGSIRIEKV